MKIGKEALISLLQGFGPGVGDLTLDAKAMSLYGTVALSTHMLHTKVSADVVTPGTLTISDSTKLLTFVKGLPKDAQVEFFQPTNSPLRVVCGKTDLQLPFSKVIRSSMKNGQALALKEDSERDNWKHWGGIPLTCYGKLKVSDLTQIQSMVKVVGKNQPITTTFSTEDKVWTVRASSVGGTNMSVGIDLEDCDGPDGLCNSHFGGWLPELLTSVPHGVVELYTADKFVAILRHMEKEHLLVILDQRGE